MAIAERVTPVESRLDPLASDVVHVPFKAAGDRTGVTYPYARSLALSVDDNGRLRTITDGSTEIATFDYLNDVWAEPPGTTTKLVRMPPGTPRSRDGGNLLEILEKGDLESWRGTGGVIDANGCMKY